MASGILGFVPDCRFCAVSSTTTGFDSHPAQQISLIDGIKNLAMSQTRKKLDCGSQCQGFASETCKVTNNFVGHNRGLALPTHQSIAGPGPEQWMGSQSGTIGTLQTWEQASFLVLKTVPD